MKGMGSFISPHLGFLPPSDVSVVPSLSVYTVSFSIIMMSALKQNSNVVIFSDISDISDSAVLLHGRCPSLPFLFTFSRGVAEACAGCAQKSPQMAAVELRGSHRYPVGISITTRSMPCPCQGYAGLPEGHIPSTGNRILKLPLIQPGRDPSIRH